MTVTTSAFLVHRQKVPQEDPFDPGVSRELVHQQVRAAGKVWVSGEPSPPGRRPSEPLIVWRGAGDLDVEADTVVLVGSLRGAACHVRIACRMLEVRGTVLIDCSAPDGPKVLPANVLAAARSRAGGKSSPGRDPAARGARAARFDANPRGHIARQRLRRDDTLGVARFFSRHDPKAPEADHPDPEAVGIAQALGAPLLKPDGPRALVLQEISAIEKRWRDAFGASPAPLDADGPPDARVPPVPWTLIDARPRPIPGSYETWMLAPHERLMTELLDQVAALYHRDFSAGSDCDALARETFIGSQPAAAPGEQGLDGVDGGSITLIAQRLLLDSDLTLRADGGRGAPGFPGHDGAGGDDGEPLPDDDLRLFAGEWKQDHRLADVDATRANWWRTRARPGGCAGAGGRGGAGGTGGRGGRIVVWTLDVQGRRGVIDARCRGGDGGPGGRGGDGGPGGRGWGDDPNGSRFKVEKPTALFGDHWAIPAKAFAGGDGGRGGDAGGGGPGGLAGSKGEVELLVPLAPTPGQRAGAAAADATSASGTVRGAVGAGTAGVHGEPGAAGPGGAGGLGARWVPGGEEAYILKGWLPERFDPGADGDAGWTPPRYTVCPTDAAVEDTKPRRSALAQLRKRPPSPDTLRMALDDLRIMRMTSNSPEARAALKERLAAIGIGALALSRSASSADASRAADDLLREVRLQAHAIDGGLDVMNRPRNWVPALAPPPVFAAHLSNALGSLARAEEQAEKSRRDDEAAGNQVQTSDFLLRQTESVLQRGQQRHAELLRGLTDSADVVAARTEALAAAAAAVPTASQAVADAVRSTFQMEWRDFLECITQLGFADVHKAETPLMVAGNVGLLIDRYQHTLTNDEGVPVNKAYLVRRVHSVSRGADGLANAYRQMADGSLVGDMTGVRRLELAADQLDELLAGFSGAVKETGSTLMDAVRRVIDTSVSRQAAIDDYNAFLVAVLDSLTQARTLKQARNDAVSAQAEGQDVETRRLSMLSDALASAERDDALLIAWMLERALLLRTLNLQSCSLAQSLAKLPATARELSAASLDLVSTDFAVCMANLQGRASDGGHPLPRSVLTVIPSGQQKGGNVHQAPARRARLAEKGSIRITVPAAYPRDVHAPGRPPSTPFSNLLEVRISHVRAWLLGVEPQDPEETITLLLRHSGSSTFVRTDGTAFTLQHEPIVTVHRHALADAPRWDCRLPDVPPRAPLSGRLLGLAHKDDEDAALVSPFTDWTITIDPACRFDRGRIGQDAALVLEFAGTYAGVFTAD